MNCPSCRHEMEEQRFAANYGAQVAIDLCFPCHAIWFDGRESLQLAPGSTLRLFRNIHEHRDEPRHPVADSTFCPRCEAPLVETHDLQRTTRFTYLRCPAGHGRFTTFFQFLREKNIVRTLDAKQLADLRAQVQVINCSNCGAPVDLDLGMACRHCRAPLSVLDPTAVQSALGELKASEDKKAQGPDPALPLTLLIDRMKVDRFYDQLEAADRAAGRRRNPGERIVGDLLDWGISRVMDVIKALG